jgi:hypothetical protein
MRVLSWLSTREKQSLIFSLASLEVSVILLVMAIRVSSWS